MGPFTDRQQAAQALATRLAAEALTPPIVVLALPRGCAPCASARQRNWCSRCR
jgi:predicted phosphoribosyltransferase